MAWGGQFVFGDAFAAYFGPSDDNDLHEHAAYQIVLSAEATRLSSMKRAISMPAEGFSFAR